jgi:small GTP-binding protein
MSQLAPDGIPRDTRAALKTILAGNSGVGKTCLISAFQKQNFNRRTTPTVAPSYIQQVVQKRDGTSLVVQIWDTAGQERFSSISQLFFRDAHCALVCFDPSEPVSITGAKEWARRVLTEVPECHLFGVMTKSDKYDSKQIDGVLQEARTQLEGIGIEQFFATSAVTRSGVDGVLAEIAELQVQGVAVHIRAADENGNDKCC